MKNYNARITKYNLITIVLLILIISSLFLCVNDVALAQNTDVKIPLTTDSKFETNGDIIAYTNGTTLTVAKDNNLYTIENAITTAKDIAIVNDYDEEHKIIGYFIAVLQSDGNLKMLYFNLLDNSISPFEINATQNKFNNRAIFYSNIDSIYSDGDMLYTANQRYMRNLVGTVSSFSTADGFDFDFVDFVILNGRTYCITKDNKIRCLLNDTVYKAEYDASIIFDSYAPTSITASGDSVYFNDNKRVMKYTPSNTSSSDIVAKEVGYLDSKSSVNKLTYSIYNEIPYIYELSINDLSIKQYEITDNSLKYVNTFNNTEYNPPTANSIVKVARAKNDVIVYISPVTKISIFNLAEGDLFLVLDEKDNHYYVTDAKGKYGYIDKDSDSSKISLITPLTDTILGKQAQILHPGTKMYSLPYDSASVVKTFTKEDLTLVLSVDYCLANEEGVDLWGWYKVSYLGDDGNQVIGYIKSSELSPYTSFTAPTVKKSAKVKAESFGSMVTIYTLADESSNALIELVDGTEILLLEKFNKDSTWTKVQYGDNIGYIKTANVQLTGLTSVQIFVITIVALVVVATIIIVIIFCIKRRHNSH